jgi:hypothetical protein
MSRDAWLYIAELHDAPERVRALLKLQSRDHGSD